MKNNTELKEALAAAGIHSGTELAEAIKKETPVLVGLMTARKAEEKTA